MKKLLFLLMFLLPFIGFAQQLPEKDPSDENVFIAVEVMPEFPGGTAAMMEYLSKSVKYPSDALEAKITGKVFVSFIINEKGKVTDAKVLRGIGTSCDNEAIRVVNEMPNWKPGTQSGKAVKVKYTLPIAFKLS
ncbi:MAG: energy transducer TonB [Bacteroidetes bacterium]|nr:energy transducer TonB [Bacteroidota bacterium]